MSVLLKMLVYIIIYTYKYITSTSACNLFKFNSSTHFRRIRLSYICFFCCYCTAIIRACKCQLGAAVVACGWFRAKSKAKRAGERYALYLLMHRNSYSRSYLLVVVRVDTYIDNFN